jgi:hypothetical protein
MTTVRPLCEEPAVTPDRARSARRTKRPIPQLISPPHTTGKHAGLAGWWRPPTPACRALRALLDRFGIVRPAEVFETEDTVEDSVIDECGASNEFRYGCAGGDGFGDQGGGGVVCTP